MKKRILSLLLCLIMVVGLLPTHVHADDEYEDGFDCEYCGGYVYGDWICVNGGYHCGVLSDRYDCYSENHCSSCGGCFDGSEDYICPDCGIGSCCLSDGEYCIECGLCLDCGEGICWNCNRCTFCTETMTLCEYCGMCYDDSCGGMCSEGTDHFCAYDHAGYTCSSCDKCLLTQGDDGEYDTAFCNQCYRCEECLGDDGKCSAWDGDSHDLCLECHDDYDYCPECHYCWLDDMINETGTPLGCMDCGRCINCVDKICETCAKCTDCIEICERCNRKCTDCHEEEGKACPYCGLCSEGVGVRCSDCGACGDCVSRCDSCRACLNCRSDTHCLDCGACGREVELCDGCGRCPECTDYCEECDMCAYCEVDTHCSVCYEHNDYELCLSCGACANCVELCSDCGECLDCADDTNHCSECGVCYELEDVCVECGMCNDCATAADRHCSNDCGNCLESYLYCDECNKCIECIEEDDEYCYSCYRCKSHHVGGKCNGKSDHTHKFGDWVSSASHHWQECRLCKDEQSKAVHVFNSEMICTVCGYDAKEPITITAQPKAVRTKVSDTSAELNDPLCPNNNNVSFKVEARATNKDTKGTLSYQWYYRSWGGSTAYPVEDCDNSEDGSGVITGAKTSKLTTFVDWEACISELRYFCRITLTSSTGEVLYTVDSDEAELKASHVYNRCKPVNAKQDHKIWLLREDGSADWTWVWTDDGGHKNFCCGEGDEERANPMQEMVLHNYSTPVTIQASLYESGPFEEYYKYTCVDCKTVSYVRKHEHQFALDIEHLEANCTNHTHPMHCTVEGCTAVSHEKHSFIPKVYAPPVKNDNDTVTPGRYVMECRQCGYTIGGRELYEANDETLWDTFRTLISADHAAVEVNKTYGDFGFGTFGLAVPGDTVNLIPHQKDGKKVVGWTNKYTDYTTKYSGGENDGKYVTVDNIGFTYYKEADGTWWFVMQNDEYLNSFGVNSGGWLHFTPVYVECKHENGTRLANKVDAVCIYSGYTGDEVCVDCGQIIGKVGDFVPAPSDDHTGEWELIEGTDVEATCEQKGYTGDFKCSDCGDIKAGENLGYKHGHTTVKNTRKGTCVTPAYTGDIYCTKCNNVIRSGKILSLDENNHAHTHTDLKRAATCVKPGSTGYIVCDDCGKTLSTPKSTPALGHVWGEGVVTKEPTETETGTKTFRCTREGCNGIKTETIPSLTSTVIESVELTVTAPAAGGTASAATTTDTACIIAATSWLDESGNDVAIGSAFESDVTYTVKVELEAVEPNVFVASTAFTVNGEAATVVALGTDSVTLEYAFPPFEESITPPAPPTPPADEHTVTVETNGHGTASASPASGKEGTLITLSYSADTGYHFKEWQVISGEVTIVGNTFTMPASNVTVKAIFEMDKPPIGPTPVEPVKPVKPVKPVDPVKPVEPEEPAETEKPVEPEKPANPFIDVPAGQYYADAVLWAVENGITTGVDDVHFDPNGVCNRAQAVTFLWRAAGSPAPQSTEMPFTDVVFGSYYYDAVLWAVENGITTGTSPTTFSPDADCSRAEIATFLWRSQNSPASAAANPFADVSVDSYYYDAVLWAVENGITMGTSATIFNPDGDCSRAEIVTFIYRCKK